MSEDLLEEAKHSE